MKGIPIDCVLVGYNDVDFAGYVKSQKIMSSVAGGYHEVKTNSLYLQGKRVPYMQMLNHAITRATGKNPQLNVFEAPALGAVYLRNYLMKRGHSAEIVNFFNYGKEHLEALLASGPTSVAITTTFYIDSAPVIEIVKFIRERNPQVKIIVGGPHIYNLAADLDGETLRYMFEQMGADLYIIESQGEQTLSQVVGCLVYGETSLDDIPNLYFARSNGSWQRTPRQPENNNLEENRIDWSAFDPKLVAPIAYLRTARSCPFKCSFCNYPTMAGAHVYTGVDTIEYELNALHAQGTRYVVFIDDTFNVPLPRFKQMLRMMIKNQYHFSWVSFLRCGNADQEAIDLMKESGCVGVLLGIESGDQTILKNMNKAATLNRYQWGLAELNKAGIASFVSLICGYPGETEQTVANTVQFIQESAPTFFNAQLYYHDTRAPIQRRAEEFGIQGSGYGWRHNTMTWQEAAHWAGHMFKAIKSSTPLGLYGFSLWGISYLLSKNISMQQIRRFGEITRPMLIDSIDDIQRDYTREESQLIELFRSPALSEAVV